DHARAWRHVNTVFVIAALRLREASRDIAAPLSSDHVSIQVQLDVRDCHSNTWNIRHAARDVIGSQVSSVTSTVLEIVPLMAPAWRFQAHASAVHNTVFVHVWFALFA